MPKIVTSRVEEPVRVEWTKYFVNGVECEKEDIYQTILSRKLYEGKIELDKKYHFESNERESTETVETNNEGLPYFRNRTSSTHRYSSSSNRSSHFGLDTKEFAKKFPPESIEFNLLVDKMIYTLDMFYKASGENYNDYSQNFQMAVRGCMSFFLEKVMNTSEPYNGIMYKLRLEQIIFLLDLLALSLSKAVFFEEDMTLPVLGIDMSSIREDWAEHSTSRKKSQFLGKYLSVMLAQTEVVFQNCKEHQLFATQSSRDELQNKFDKYKRVVASLQVDKTTLDASLPAAHRPSLLSTVASFFHRKSAQVNENGAKDLAVHAPR